MTSIEEIQSRMLANLLVHHPNLVHEVTEILGPLPEKFRGDMLQKIVSQSGDGKFHLQEDPPLAELPLPVLTASQILKTDWPEPVWAVPNLLPVGLTILAGAPKIGKSWLSLQLARAVASGGKFLYTRATIGSVLVCALEDSPQRLQARMKAMGWTESSAVDFLTIAQLKGTDQNLFRDGVLQLTNQIRRNNYRLVVIDTLSRAIPGDQQDVQAMTRGLTPLQEMSHQLNCAILLCDHHRKAGGMETDAIADILGSTAKGAIADTVWSLYRQRGKTGAKLAVSGRDIEEQTYELDFDRKTSQWQYKGPTDGIEITERRREILEAVKWLGKAREKHIAQYIGQPTSNTHTRLQDLVNDGKINRIEEGGEVFYELA